ncbi:MAG: anti-sigma factor [Phycisphaerae bacterium]
MDRESFEQLLSEWLDRRDDAELAARIAERVAAAPERRSLVAAWERMDALLRGAALPMRVDWPRFASRVSAALRVDDAEGVALERWFADLTRIESRVAWPTFAGHVAAAIRASQADAADGGATAASATGDADDAPDAALDRLVARATDVDSRVAWRTYAERIADAAHIAQTTAAKSQNPKATPRVPRFGGVRRLGSLAGLAAAAAIALFAFLTSSRQLPPTSSAPIAIVDVQVASPTFESAAAPAGGASVDVAVAEETVPPDAPDVALAPRDAEPEMLVVIESPADSGPLVAYNDPYGLF